MTARVTKISTHAYTVGFAWQGQGGGPARPTEYYGVDANSKLEALEAVAKELYESEDIQESEGLTFEEYFNRLVDRDDPTMFIGDESAFSVVYREKKKE